MPEYSGQEKSYCIRVARDAMRAVDVDPNELVVRFYRTEVLCFDITVSDGYNEKVGKVKSRILYRFEGNWAKHYSQAHPVYISKPHEQPVDFRVVIFDEKTGSGEGRKSNF